MTTAPGSDGRRSQPIEDLTASTVPVGYDPTLVTEARVHLDGAATLLSYGLLGQMPLELAVESALRLIDMSLRYLKAAS
jgi:hypothetical protein